MYIHSPHLLQAKKGTYLKVLSNLQISKGVKSPRWNGAFPETLQQREMPKNTRLWFQGKPCGPHDAKGQTVQVLLKLPQKTSHLLYTLATRSVLLIHGCHLPLRTLQNSHKSICLTEARHHEKSQLQRKINVIFSLSSFKVEGRHI